MKKLLIYSLIVLGISLLSACADNHYQNPNVAPVVVVPSSSHRPPVVFNDTRNRNAWHQPHHLGGWHHQHHRRSWQHQRGGSWHHHPHHHHRHHHRHRHNARYHPRHIHQHHRR